MSVVIIDTGVSNTASVRAATRRAAGAEPALTTDPREVERAERVILPGVGAFAAGMAALERHVLAAALRERVAQGRPTLAICLGMQLLCEASEESPGVRGLGLIETTVRRFPPDAPSVPHFGWNAVTPGAPSPLTPGYAYFAHSYRVEQAPPGWTAATSVHAGEFVAALSRGNVLACQFHPELSGRWGARLIEHWARASVEQKAAT